jgi:hypothetical protein
MLSIKEARKWMTKLGDNQSRAAIRNGKVEVLMQKNKALILKSGDAQVTLG